MRAKEVTFIEMTSKEGEIYQKQKKNKISHPLPGGCVSLFISDKFYFKFLPQFSKVSNHLESLFVNRSFIFY